MQLILTRYAFTPTETQGRLSAGKKSRKFQTIERPWIVGPHPGGMSFESCIPDGEYELHPHTRPNGDKVVALVNEELGVWYQKEDRPDPWGRYLVLIHSGNYIEDIVGCIAPGLTRTIYKNRFMVGSSRAAMSLINVQKYKSISIQPGCGTDE